MVQVKMLLAVTVAVMTSQSTSASSSLEKSAAVTSQIGISTWKPSPEPTAQVITLFGSKVSEMSQNDRKTGRFDVFAGVWDKFPPKVSSASSYIMNTETSRSSKNVIRKKRAENRPAISGASNNQSEIQNGVRNASVFTTGNNKEYPEDVRYSINTTAVLQSESEKSSGSDRKLTKSSAIINLKLASEQTKNITFIVKSSISSENRTDEATVAVDKMNSKISTIGNVSPTTETIIKLEPDENLDYSKDMTSWPTDQSAKIPEGNTRPFLGWTYRRHCGKRPLLEHHSRWKRIVGGRATGHGQYPWQVLIKSSKFFGLFEKRKCGGVLISSKHILTAAHCKPALFESLEVILGVHDLKFSRNKPKPTVIGVKKVIVHKQFDPSSFSNDIAIMELNEPVHFKPSIYPICLPGPWTDFTGKFAVVSGWGKLAYGGRAPDMLQHVEVPIISNEICQKWFDQTEQVKNIKPYFLCAGYKDGGQDSCAGDSGSPLSIQDEDGRWTVAAIVSHGINCAQPNMPGIYMKTTHYLSWILSIVHDL